MDILVSNNKTWKKKEKLTNGPNDARGIVWAHFCSCRLLRWVMWHWKCKLWLWNGVLGVQRESKCMVVGETVDDVSKCHSHTGDIHWLWTKCCLSLIVEYCRVDYSHGYMQVGGTIMLTHTHTHSTHTCDLAGFANPCYSLATTKALIRHPFPYLWIFTFLFISLSKVTNKPFPKAYDTKAQQIHTKRTIITFFHYPRQFPDLIL